MEAPVGHVHMTENKYLPVWTSKFEPRELHTVIWVCAYEKEDDICNYHHYVTTTTLPLPPLRYHRRITRLLPSCRRTAHLVHSRALVVGGLTIGGLQSDVIVSPASLKILVRLDVGQIVIFVRFYQKEVRVALTAGANCEEIIQSVC